MAASFQSIEKSSSSTKSAAEDAAFLKSLEAEEVKMELITLLQSTLELNLILKHFLDALRQKMKIDGLCYAEDTREIKLKIGRQSSHSCGYRLSNNANHCGEITFKRSTRFSESDLEAIEGLISLLLIPVANALAYHDAAASAINRPSNETMDKKGLQLVLQREIELAKRHNHPLSLIHIKFEFERGQFDKQEHEMEMLSIAAKIRKEIASTDLLFRSATEEFLLLTPNDNKHSKILISALNEMDLFHGKDNSEGSAAAIITGLASLTGTDSVRSLIARSKRHTY